MDAAGKQLVEKPYRGGARSRRGSRMRHRRLRLHAGSDAAGPLVDARSDPVEVTFPAQVRTRTTHLLACDLLARGLDNLVKAQRSVGGRVHTQYWGRDLVSGASGVGTC